MDTKIIDNIAVVNSNAIVIKDAASALEFVMTIKRKTHCHKIALNKTAVVEDFFILSSGLAREILQKFVNYNIQFAIYGDFSKYTSKPLKDFIYESNQGKNIFFVTTSDKAKEMLSQ